MPICHPHPSNTRQQPIQILRMFLCTVTKTPLICTALYYFLLPFYCRLYISLSISSPMTLTIPFARGLQISISSDAIFFASIATLLHMSLYWTVNTFFWICDRGVIFCVCQVATKKYIYKMCGKQQTKKHTLIYQPSWIYKYKLERKPSQLPKASLIKEALIDSFTGQVFLEPLEGIFVLFPCFTYFGMVCGGESLNVDKF